MRLHRLEITGFKSFPDRAELAFDHGVTAIVGPNGCGKSNLVDAITWVLGEQSARSLRGDRMEDVIFSGSDARKPTAAAEVKLKLAGVTALPGWRGNGGTGGNGHHHGGDGNGSAAQGVAVAEAQEAPPVARDVEVARRLYRSGESEYLIDGEVCRLRDVQDLLMDAGLGVKAYAVIEQGKIGQILSARPAERRQLIEEAAGVTKYKSRRRAAELKLEAAQQNLTRLEDIVFEVEKQRSALKRQAARARRYRRLREDLRRWEKVLFAGRYRVLSEAIAAARAELAGAQASEAAVAARLAALETALERLRLELTEADARAATVREAAHTRELAMERRQQQVALDRQQLGALAEAARGLDVEIGELRARRDPAHAELDERRAAAARADMERDEAAALLATEETAYRAVQRQIEGLEADVEAARGEVFAAINAATALRHAIEHAGAAGGRSAERLAKLDIEAADLRTEGERAAAAHRTASAALDEVRQALAVTGAARSAREAELAALRELREDRTRELRAREHDLAVRRARLRSLEEIDAARAQYGEAARMILAEPDSRLEHYGSIADYLEVEHGHERAVEACLGDLLQYVVVARHDDARAGLEIVRERNAGPCGFLIVQEETATVSETARAAFSALGGLTPVTSVARVSGPYREPIARAIGHAWVAGSYDQAQEASRTTGVSIATLAGEVFRGPQLVQGGGRADARGILTTKREIKELREGLGGEEEVVHRLSDELGHFALALPETEAAVSALVAEQHAREKTILGLELQCAGAADEAERIARKQELIAHERRQAEEERSAIEARQQEARSSIARLEGEQRMADERLTAAQRLLFEAREAVEARALRVADAKAAHAALVERSAALVSEVRRLADASGELEARIAGRTHELERAHDRRAHLEQAIADGARLFDEDVRALDALRADLRAADEGGAALRRRFEAEEAAIRQARQALEEARAGVSRLEISRATAEADLSHLAAACQDALQSGLAEILAEVEQIERQGAAPGAAPLEPEDVPEDVEEASLDGLAAAPPPAESEAVPPIVSAEEAIAGLRARIDRLGPVNMMAVEQFDELEARHTFLTSQRKDLLDSIAATGEAIRRIDRTTRERFREAFTVINDHFQQTFATLFGGGRAGLVLLDETDLLESGIDIIAQPPGKRLQNVQLLSGGEKALTAMALMFAIFKYRPSPFCLLDEIDAPLDDANIGRFVDMLQGLQDETQFILVTHNRRTMEIADRLYGVTMEEPGVSKLISVQLN